MKYHVLRNKITGLYVSGTDYRYNRPPRPIMATELRPPLLFTAEQPFFDHEIEKRGINLTRYEVLTIEF